MLSTAIWLSDAASYESSQPVGHAEKPMYSVPRESNKAARCRHALVSVMVPFTASEFVPGTEAGIVTGLPARCWPVVTSSACRRNEKALPACCAETRYIVLDPASITGVEVSPWTGLGFPPACGTAPGCSSEVFHRGLPSPKLSASKA